MVVWLIPAMMLGRASGSCTPGSARGLLLYLDLRRFQLVEAQQVSHLAERCGDLLPAQETQE